MFALYRKEISSFFTTLTGYLIMLVFLVVTGLMLWVFRGDYNILDYGYAGLDGLFVMAPYLYLFLIPAIMMRMLAEEKRGGTMELLLTKPISEWQIVSAKFWSGLTLVVIALLPTVVYYVSVWMLGDPQGNVDSGAVAGSYVGLICLAAAFAAISLFASSLTNNQIVAFVVGALLCAFCYMGFGIVYRSGCLGKAGLVVDWLGLSHHYSSISRGVIDTRDLLYFAGVVVLFMLATRVVLQSRGWERGAAVRKSQRRYQLLQLGAAVLIVVFVNIISSLLFARLDLTAERRYTLSKSTKEMLRRIDEPVLFRVYLEGEFPSDFKRLQNETREMLNQFRAYSRYVDYEFVNPNEFGTREERQVFYEKLARKGIQPTQIQVNTQGGVTQQVLVPAADVSYRGRETSVQLLQNQKYVSEEQLLNNSIQDLEYVLSNAIRTLARGVQPKVGFLLGHGELERGALYDIQMSLLEYYRLENVVLDNNINALTGRLRAGGDTAGYHFANKFDVLVVPKPTRAFSDRDLYLIDQYVMYGGKVLWLVDALDADMDSLTDRPQMLAVRNAVNLDQMFFTYGVRVNADMVMDIRCRPIPMAVGMVGDKPQIRFCPWYYFPELMPASEHPVVRNLDLVKTDFASSIDLIDNDIKKTVLLATSDYTRVKNAPVLIDLNDGKVEPDRRLFDRQRLPVAVLLEGSFHSMWRNRLAPSFTELPEMGYREQSDTTKMIVIADGDIIKNRYNYDENSGYPLGYDYYTNTMYANKELVLNAINYLAGDEDFMSSRSRTLKMRKLSTVRLREHRTVYQVVNVALPALLVLLASAVVLPLRKRKNRR